MGEPREPLTNDALEVWRRQLSPDITAEEARQCDENLIGFFHVLLEWDAAEQKLTGRRAEARNALGSPEHEHATKMEEPD